MTELPFIHAANHHAATMNLCALALALIWTALGR